MKMKPEARPPGLTFDHELLSRIEGYFKVLQEAEIDLRRIDAIGQSVPVGHQGKPVAFASGSQADQTQLALGLDSDVSHEAHGQRLEAQLLEVPRIQSGAVRLLDRPIGQK